MSVLQESQLASIASSHRQSLLDSEIVFKRVRGPKTARIRSIEQTCARAPPPTRVVNGPGKCTKDQFRGACGFGRLDSNITPWSCQYSDPNRQTAWSVAQLKAARPVCQRFALQRFHHQRGFRAPPYAHIQTYQSGVVTSSLQCSDSRFLRFSLHSIQLAPDAR
jgi:hypothetical protein